MARQSIQRVLEWLGRVITQPHDELTRWQAAVRFAYDLGRYGARQLRRDQAPQMAAALSYRTLFGLLPVIVVGTLVVRAVGGFGDFEEWLASFFSSAGLDGFEIAAAPAGIATDPAGAGDVAATGQTLSEWLLTIVSQTETLNLAAITWVGVAVVIYSALSLVGTIEGCFNAICRAPEGRSWTRRVPIYWTVLTLGPAAIFFAAYAERRFSQFMGDHVSWGWVLRIAPTIWSFGAAWLVMFIAYKLLPNTRVKTPAAVMGALMAAVLLEIGKRTMGAYLSNALSIRQLYGSLGLIPLFMFWVYLMWLVVLFGLEVTATLQMLAGRTLEEIESKRRASGLVDPAAVLVVMEVVADRFARSGASTSGEIANETGVAEPIVRILLDGLVERGLLNRVDREDGGVTLARHPGRIDAREVIDVGFCLADEGGIGRKSAILPRLRDVQRGLASKITLTELLAGQPVAPASDQAGPA